jgi:hypothetical protein
MFEPGKLQKKLEEIQQNQGQNLEKIDQLGAKLTKIICLCSVSLILTVLLFLHYFQTN